MDDDSGSSVASSFGILDENHLSKSASEEGFFEEGNQCLGDVSKENGVTNDEMLNNVHSKSLPTSSPPEPFLGVGFSDVTLLTTNGANRILLPQHSAQESRTLQETENSKTITTASSIEKTPTMAEFNLSFSTPLSNISPPQITSTPTFSPSLPPQSTLLSQRPPQQPNFSPSSQQPAISSQQPQQESETASTKQLTSDSHPSTQSSSTTTCLVNNQPMTEQEESKGLEATSQSEPLKSAIFILWDGGEDGGSEGVIKRVLLKTTTIKYNTNTNIIIVALTL